MGKCGVVSKDSLCLLVLKILHFDKTSLGDYGIGLGIYEISFGVYRISFGVYRISLGVYRISFGDYEISFGDYEINIGIYRIRGHTEKLCFQLQRSLIINPDVHVRE